MLAELIALIAPIPPVRCWERNSSLSKLQIQPEALQYLRTVAAAVQRKRALLLTPDSGDTHFGFLLSRTSRRAVQQATDNKTNVIFTFARLQI